MEKRRRRQWIEGSTSPHQKSVSGSSSTTDRHLTRLLCCVHRVNLKERKRFVVHHQSTLSFERSYLHLFFWGLSIIFFTFRATTVRKMLLDRRDLYNVRRSLDWTPTQHVIHISLATSSPKRRKPFVRKLSERWSAPVRRVLIHPFHVQLRITYATQLLKVCSLQSL